MNLFPGRGIELSRPERQRRRRFGCWQRDRMSGTPLFPSRSVWVQQQQRGQLAAYYRVWAKHLEMVSDNYIDDITIRVVLEQGAKKGQ